MSDYGKSVKGLRKYEWYSSSSQCMWTTTEVLDNDEHMVTIVCLECE